MSLPPGPPLPSPVQTLLWLRRPVELMQWCRRRYGPAFTLQLPPFPMALMSDPEAIRTIFAAKQDEIMDAFVEEANRRFGGY